MIADAAQDRLGPHLAWQTTKAPLLLPRRPRAGPPSDSAVSRVSIRCVLSTQERPPSGAESRYTKGGSPRALALSMSSQPNDVKSRTFIPAGMNGQTGSRPLRVTRIKTRSWRITSLLGRSSFPTGRFISFLHSLVFASEGHRAAQRNHASRGTKLSLSRKTGKPTIWPLGMRHSHLSYGFRRTQRETPRFHEKGKQMAG